MEIGVLSDAKTEFTQNLCDILTPRIYEGIRSIYEECKSLCNDKKFENGNQTLPTFQKFLSDIAKWNNDVLMKEYERIKTKTDCKYLDDLLTAVFIAHTRVLSSIRNGNKKKKINLKIPKIYNFIHKCYINCAREFWKYTYLFHETNNKLDIQRNMKEASEIIEKCIKNTIRNCLPVKNILNEYLGENMNETEYETQDPFEEQNSIQNLIKSEIEKWKDEEKEKQKEEYLDDDELKPEEKVISEEPIVEDVVQPTTEDIREPTTENVRVHVTEYVREPVSEDIIEPVSHDVREKAVEDVAEPTTVDIREAVTEYVGEPTIHNLRKAEVDDVREVSVEEQVREAVVEDIREPHLENAEKLIMEPKVDQFVKEPDDPVLFEPITEDVVEINKQDNVKELQNSVKNEEHNQLFDEVLNSEKNEDNLQEKKINLLNKEIDINEESRSEIKNIIIDPVALKSSGTKKQKDEIDKFMGNIGSAEVDIKKEVQKLPGGNEIKQFIENNKDVLPTKNIDNFDDFNLDSDSFEEL